jgi:hypothetical protein
MEKHSGGALTPPVTSSKKSAGPSGAANVVRQSSAKSTKAVEVSPSRNQTDMCQNIFMPHFFWLQKSSSIICTCFLHSQKLLALHCDNWPV